MIQRTEGKTVVQRLANAMFDLGQASQRYQLHRLECQDAGGHLPETVAVCTAYIEALRLAGAASVEYAHQLEIEFLASGIAVASRLN
jgi:hypothetical protein